MRSFLSMLFFGFLLALVSLQNDIVVDARIHASGDAAAIPVKRRRQQHRGVVATVPSAGVLLLRMLLLLSPPFEIWPSNNPGHGTTTERFSGGSGSSSDSAAASSAVSAVARVPAVYGTKQNKQGKEFHTHTHRMEWSKIDRNETIGCD